MTYAPTNITGPITPNSNSSSTALPGVTMSGVGGGAVITSTGIARELYTRTPQIANQSGRTADYTGQLFLNNDFNGNYLNIISGFLPDYYIDTNKNLQLTMTGVTGSVSLPPSGPGTQKGRWEIFTISYTKQTFLTSLGGATASAITALSVVHDIVPGNQTITADHIFYRKIGHVS
jgi:hypothetical protein